jgi:tRNA threonylcarbamoyl adenosine modification protein YeaZ
MNDLLLSLDLSTPNGSIALLDCHQQCIDQHSFTADRSHNSKLYPPLELIFKKFPTHQIKTILVGTGPGSYTGTRIAIAAAQGIALTTQAQVIGMPTFWSIHSATPYLVVGDARRGQFWYAIINPIEKKYHLEIIPTLELSSIIEQTKLTTYTFDSPIALQSSAIQYIQPSAAILAHSYFNSIPCTFDSDEDPLQPFYLQEAFITTAKKTSLPSLTSPTQPHSRL